VRHWHFVSIFISFHAIIFRKLHSWNQQNQHKKQNLTHNSYSRSFKVTPFGITEKLTMDCVSLYNNADRISKNFWRNTQRNRWKLPLSTTLLSTLPPQRTPQISAINLISSETRVTGLIVWVYLHSNFCGRLQKTHLFCNRVHISCSRSSKSLILAPIERVHTTSY